MRLWPFSKTAAKARGDVLRVHKIRRELHNIGPIRVGRLQGGVDVCEDLGGLSPKVAITNDFTVCIARKHACDEQKLIGLDSGNMMILPHWRAELDRIVDVYLRVHSGTFLYSQ